jgi:hypothetical protein
VLSKAWGHFVDVAEVELCSFLGVEPRELGERSRTIKASWVSVFYRPKDPDVRLQVISGWKWLFNAFAEFFAVVQSDDLDERMCPHLQVALQHGCAGEGQCARLDASLRVMREIALLWRPDPSAQQSWCERSQQFLQDIQADFD